MDDSDYENMSAINGGVLKTIRIHEMLKFIGELQNNIALFNQDFGDYNFNIIKDQLDRLYLEVESKVSDERKKEPVLLRTAIKHFMLNFPIFEQKYNQVTGQRNLQLNKERLRILKEYLYQYELSIRALHDKYGLDTRYEMEDPY
jgi:hypothetical protein